MKAWQKSLGAKEKNIRFVADATGAFSKALDTTFDATPLLGNERSKRLAIATEDGKVTKVAIEPDNVGISGEWTLKLLYGVSMRGSVLTICLVSGADQFLA
jgi:peroxiredoxin 5